MDCLTHEDEDISIFRNVDNQALQPEDLSAAVYVNFGLQSNELDCASARVGHVCVCLVVMS